MMKSKANKKVAVDDKLLTLPVDAGRAIVEAGAVIACPLLGMDRFIKFCCGGTPNLALHTDQLGAGGSDQR